MIERRRFICFMVLLMCGGLTTPAAARDDPTPQVRHLMTRLQAALTPGRSPAALEAVVRHQLIPALDVEGIARQVTGPRWNASGPAARSRSQAQARARLEHVALVALREHGDEVRAWLAGAHLLPPSRPDPGHVVVRLRHPQAMPDEVRLWLTRGPRGWRVANATVAGFSLMGMAGTLLGPAAGGMMR
ncbi:MAG: ABC transporter substrate-binding protein [Gammaproteobacteria bacterium]|nr:ABC transporter substrate-binding protein [Gammaproteobacteria bacterium]